MKKAYRNTFLFSLYLLVTAVVVYLFSFIPSFLNTLGCINAEQHLYFVSNRLTGSCTYSISCPRNQLGMHSILTHKTGCSEAAVLELIKENELSGAFDNELLRRVAQCQNSAGTFGRNPEVSCKKILDQSVIY